MKALLRAAPAFSANLRIHGVNIEHFANPCISYSADGYGLRGVCSQEFSFDLPASEYGAEEFSFGEEVNFNVPETTIPLFYISSVTPGENVMKVVCYDKTMFTDKIIEISESSFDSDDNISLSALISLIEHLCGCSISYGSIIPRISKIPKDKVLNRSMREILSDLAEAACGYFGIAGADTISFVPFGHTGAVFSLNRAQKYSSICYGISKTVSYILMTDGSRTFGTMGDPQDTIVINSVYASSELAGAIINSLHGKTYRAWSCEHILMRGYPSPGAGIEFSDGLILPANYATAKFVPYGIMVSAGRNTVIESGFVSREWRELQNRVKIGELNGNTKIGRNGIVFVNENKTARSGEAVTEEYGFDVGNNGVTVYDGVIMDTVMPTNIERVSDTSRRIIYDGAAFLLSWDADDEGKRTNFKLVKENGNSQSGGE